MSTGKAGWEEREGMDLGQNEGKSCNTAGKVAMEVKDEKWCSSSLSSAVAQALSRAGVLWSLVLSRVPHPFLMFPGSGTRIEEVITLFFDIPRIIISVSFLSH